MPPSKRPEFQGGSELRNSVFAPEFRAEVQLPESTSSRHNNGCPISLSLHPYSKVNLQQALRGEPNTHYNEAARLHTKSTYRRAASSLLV